MKHSLPDIDLRNHFLLSMPHLNDGNFTHSLTYICDHSEQGAMGVIVNHPLQLSLDEILQHLELDTRALRQPDMPVYSGGPVQSERGFIVHTGSADDWQSSLQVSEEICLSTSLDVLEAIARGLGPDHFLMALGYAGWGPGQLEQEMLDNAWLSCAADNEILFSLDADLRLDAAAAKLGINLDQLSSQTGHA